MSLSCRPRTWLPNLFHDILMVASWQIHGAFMPLSHNSQLRSFTCQIHVHIHIAVVSVSCQFHVTWLPKLFHDTFMALSPENSQIVEIHYIIFLPGPRFFSDSCDFHATFMAPSRALSWQAPKTWPQTFSCHFHCTFMALALKL